MRYLYTKCREEFGSSIRPRVRSGVLLDYKDCGIEVYSPRSWDRATLPTIVVKSVCIRLEIMASWFRLRKDYGVNPQPALDRGATSVSCRSWDVLSTIIAKSALYSLISWSRRLPSRCYPRGHCKLPSRSLTDLIS